MLFHADKNVKDSMFNIYRNDIKERQQRKDNSVTKEKIEDKNFVDRIKKLNEDEMVRRSIEKLRKKNENMYSYNELWKGKDEERKNRYNRIFDPKINFPSLDPELINQSKPILLKGKSYDFNSKINFDSQRDHVNNIMNPDYLGIRNLYSLERNHKQEYQKMYRNFLDSQINTKFDLYDLNNHNLKDKEYHAMKRIEEEVLVKQNPYSGKQYEIGKTTLNYNTITNPGPNLGYNKYLTVGNINVSSQTPNIYNNDQNNKNVSPIPYKYYGNENYQEKNNLQQANVYNNYPPNSYNGSNNQMKERLQIVANNIIK